MTPDLILINGIVHTLATASPAEGLAIAHGRIRAVGTTADIRALGGAKTRAIDLAGACVLPGLTDAHVHLLWFGESLETVNLDKTRSRDEALALVAERAASLPVGAWLRGRGWDHHRWTPPMPPDRQALDQVAPHHAVVLTRKDGHSLVANTLALQRAGVNRETPDPPGGVIERDEHGDPTGILRENAAMALVYRAIPEPRDEEVEHLLEQALRAAAANGLTSVHNMDTLRVHDALARLDEADRLPIRVTSYLQRDDLDEAIHRGLRTGRGSGRLTIGGLKLFADGSLGSMTALLLDDYQGHPGQRGIAVMSSEEMEALVRRALLHGLAPAIHAIGDAANRLVLDLYARVPRPKDLRLRLEHAQLLHPRDIPRLAHLGVVASMQPIHAPSDRPIAERLWGARSRFGYAWRSMLDSGVHLAFGSDCPVETIDPRQGIYAAVERRSPGDVDTLPWYPEQAITVQEAIAAYTRGAAYAAGREHEQGVITPGMRADLTILSHDIMACPPSEILQAKVVMTIVDGTIVDAW